MIPAVLTSQILGPNDGPEPSLHFMRHGQVDQCIVFHGCGICTLVGCCDTLSPWVRMWNSNGTCREDMFMDHIVA